jgi:MFS family permease
MARPAGRLVDARDSRHLLVGAGIAETACTIPLVFLHSVIPIVILVAVLGAAASVSTATWSALVPRVVGEDHVAGAVSAQQSLNALVMVGAPAIGGLLAGAFGPGLPLAIDAATFVAVTLAAAAVRTRRAPAPRPAGGGPARARGGFQIVRADRVLAPLMAGAALVVLLVGMVDVVLVFLVRQTLHAGGVWFGAAGAAWMAGMVAGSLASGRIGTDRARTRAAILGLGVTCAALVPFAVVPDVWMLFPLSVLGGAANGCAATCLSALLVSRTPEHERRRGSGNFPARRRCGRCCPLTPRGVRRGRPPRRRRSSRDRHPGRVPVFRSRARRVARVRRQPGLLGCQGGPCAAAQPVPAPLRGRNPGGGVGSGRSCS